MPTSFITHILLPNYPSQVGLKQCQVNKLKFFATPPCLSLEIPGSGINYTSFHRSDVLTHVHVCQYKFLSMVLTRRQREFRKERCERRKTVTVENVKYPILPSRRRLFDTLSQSLPCLNKWYVKRRSFRRLIIYEATRATISEDVSFNLSIPPAPSAPACKATVPLDWLWRLTI